MIENNDPQINGQALIRIFSKLNDPRDEGRCLHYLPDIIFITICAILCGAKQWKQIAEFGRQRLTWLRKFVRLENGIPSHQTFCRLFSLIPAEELLACFMEWSSSHSKRLPGDIIAIDGKTLRKSGHKAAGGKPLHLINAYLTREKLTIGAIKTPDKSNEIKGIPPLLKSLNIAKCIITIDAMGTQKGIANLIISKQADYVLALKKNQGQLYKKVSHLFQRAQELNYESMVYKKNKTVDVEHSRYETREYTYLPMMYLPLEKKVWKGLQTFVEVKSIRHFGDQKEGSLRYYISSLTLKNHLMSGNAIRQHWDVENRLHWKLDVAMREDDCRIYHPAAAENFSTLRKVVLALLEREHSVSGGIAMKQWKAALQPSYLRKLVGF